MKKRNPDARCENCPFWKQIVDRGECRQFSPAYERPKIITFPDYWCGQHPEFFLYDNPYEALDSHRKKA